MKRILLTMISFYAFHAAGEQGQMLQLKCLVESPSGKIELSGEPKLVTDNIEGQSLKLETIKLDSYELIAEVSYGKTFTNLDDQNKPQLLVTLNSLNEEKIIRRLVIRGFGLEKPITQPIEAGEIFFSPIGRIDYSCGIVKAKN